MIKSALIQNSRYGVKDRCLEFVSRTNRGVNCGTHSSLQLTNYFSVECWAYIAATYTNSAWMVSKWIGMTGRRNWAIYMAYVSSTPVFRAIVRASNDSKDFLINSTYDLTNSANLNKWVHIAFTFDKDNDMILYVNGVNDGSVSAGASLNHNSTVVYINGIQNCVGFTGRIDEVRIWNHARTAEQIKRYMHTRLYGTETGLVAYYPMDEGTGSTAYDMSQNSNNGTITGATWIKP